MTDRVRYYPGTVDSHAHLSLLHRKELDPHQIVAAAATGGMRCVVDVGVEPSDTDDRLTRFGDSPLVVFTAGLHPTSVTPDRHTRELGILESVLRAEAELVACGQRRSIVAVGELGLDFYWSTEHTELQLDALRRQFDLAASHDLPVVIHNRDSEATMLAELRAHRPRGVMHCFSQDEDYCRACLDLDLFISFGGNLTYRSSDDIRAAARIVPDDRLLVETDSPYLSPQSVRGTANHPGHLGFVIEALAEVRGMRPEEIAAITAANAASLLGLTPREA